MQNQVIEKVKEPIQKIVDQENLHLYDLEFVKEEGIYFLRVSIEKKDKTMDFETCEKVSEKISEMLDQIDPIDHEYILEVCSPGAERPLKTKQDYYDAIHSYVQINVLEAIDKKSSFTGDLIEVNEDYVVVSYKDKTRTKQALIVYENIADAHLAVKF